ncbi:hypothetical protein NLU13_4247 [Sarocladium strictum]|uniref:Uncharacterized protein n=1 Tax=Sarocladium strictum TaxID=5046 RepID=A0AA39GJW6_SARSR|nr:hypothetical protein NLU13_4247 [Sarocladium strictum]
MMEGPRVGGLVSQHQVLAASASPTATPPKVRCDECGASFSRREHLQRHMRSHTNERPYTCSQCGNAFSRMDVLAKHAESHNQKNAVTPRVSKAFPRACFECATIRIRCSRGEPCQRCGDRGLKCTYPTARKRKASKASSGEEDTRDMSTGFVSGEAQRRNEPINAAVSMDHEATGTEPPATSPKALSSLGTSNSHRVSGWGLEDDAEVTLQPPSPSRIPVEPPGGSALGALGNSQMAQNMDWFSLNWLSPNGATVLGGFDHTNPAVDSSYQTQGIYDLFNFPLAPGLGPGEPWAWPASAPNVDRTLPPLDPSPVSGQIAEGQIHNSNPRIRDVVDGTDTSSASRGTPATLYVDGGASRAPFKGLAAQRGINIDDEESVEGSDIDPLSVTGQCAKGGLSWEAVGNILSGVKNSVSLEQLRGGCFPTSQQLQAFFRLYFRYFHPSFPFLRPDSGYYDDESRWPLALAICAVGAQYCTKTDSTLTRHFMTEVLHQYNCNVNDQAPLHGWYPSCVEGSTSDDTVERQLCVIQALLLDLICHFYAAIQPSVQHTSTSHFKVVQMCRDMGLLKKSCPKMELPVSPDIASSVNTWALQQSCIRTGYMVWLLDSILSIENESETLLSLGDIQCDLPCRESVWRQPSAAAIARGGANTLGFLDAMEMLYIEKKLPKGLDEFGTIIMVHAIIQRTKAVVKQYQTGLASWIPSASSQKRAPSRRVEETWPPCLPILSRWRNSACDCLDVLHWNANSISARDGGWETFTIFHLHFSRLVLLAPLGPLRVLACPGTTGRSASVRHALAIQEARQKILNWAINDQYKARLAVIHAGALFWHVRRYSINSFVEPIGIYLATLVLWGYSMASQSNNQIGLTQNEGVNHPLAHTEDSYDRSDPSPNPTSSIRSTAESSPLSGIDEDPEVVQFYVDRPCDDEIVQAYVRHGRRMTARLSHVGELCHIDAPQRVIIQGQRILEARQRANKQRSSRGDASSPLSSGVPVTWGITEHYLKILRDFLQAECT